MCTVCRIPCPGPMCLGGEAYGTNNCIVTIMENYSAALAGANPISAPPFQAWHPGAPSRQPWPSDGWRPPLPLGLPRRAPRRRPPALRLRPGGPQHGPLRRCPGSALKCVSGWWAGGAPMPNLPEIVTGQVGRHRFQAGLVPKTRWVGGWGVGLLTPPSLLTYPRVSIFSSRFFASTMLRQRNLFLQWGEFNPPLPGRPLQPCLADFEHEGFPGGGREPFFFS